MCMHYFDLTGLIVDMMVVLFGIVVMYDHVKTCDKYHGSGRPSVDHVCSSLPVQGADWSLGLEPDRQRRLEIYGSGRVA